MFNSQRARKGLVLILVFFVLAPPLFSGCAKRPSPEEVTRLEETRQAAEAAEKELEKKKAEKADLEAKLAQKKEELKQLEAKRDEVKSKLEEREQ